MSIEAKYDPLLFKFPKGAIVKNTKVKFHIDFSGYEEPKKVYFMLKNDEESDYKYLEMSKNNGYEISHYFAKSGQFWYNFQLLFEDRCLYLNKTYDTRSMLSEEKKEDFLQLVTEAEYKCTNSMQGGIIYQIFVDRFCKAGEVKCREPLIMRDDWGGKIQKNTTDPLIINLEVFGGNFKGIISKLDYLKDLGVTVIYLNPICQANSNHKYNTVDYMKIDDMFGTEEDFKTLVEKAKSKGIRIVIDGVYNHTGSDSIYFDKDGKFSSLGAFESKKSKYYGWFDFEEYPKKYNSWWGIETLPSINKNLTSFQDFIAGKGGVLEKYLNLGVGGVRLDVVDEITDIFVRKIRDKVLSYDKNNVVLGEVWEDASTKISYGFRRQYFTQNELNSVMNYPVKETVLEYIFNKNSNTLEATLRMLQNNYPKIVRDNLMNFLSTHDTKRVFSELIRCADGDEETAKKLYKIASALIFTLPGVPSIFYGDEYGMENNDDSSRGCFDWNNYNNEIFKWFKQLTEIRKHPALKDGDFNVLYSANGVFAFERYNHFEHIVVVSNLGKYDFELKLNGEFVSFLTGKMSKLKKLKPNEFEILIETKN